MINNCDFSLLLDHDGDKITIFNTLDFEIFYDLMIQKVFVVVSDNNESFRYIPTTEEGPQASNEAGAAASSSTGAQAIPAAGVRHTDVICDSCENEIYGYRYKCLQCRDFDLCMQCEAKLKHQEHAMIRIPDSSEFVSIRFVPHCSTIYIIEKVRSKTSEKMYVRDCIWGTLPMYCELVIF